MSRPRLSFIWCEKNSPAKPLSQPFYHTASARRYEKRLKFQTMYESLCPATARSPGILFPAALFRKYVFHSWFSLRQREFHNVVQQIFHIYVLQKRGGQRVVSLVFRFGGIDRSSFRQAFCFSYLIEPDVPEFIVSCTDHAPNTQFLVESGASSSSISRAVLSWPA